jgi:hypothetical protein
MLAGMVSAAGAALDGTRWSVTVTPDTAAKKAGEKPSKDTLIFKDGQLTSTACVKYGFAPSAYTATGTSTKASFQAEQTSAKEGKTSWSGHATEGTITGTMTWTKQNGQTLQYTFSGKRSKTL